MVFEFVHDDAPARAARHALARLLRRRGRINQHIAGRAPKVGSFVSRTEEGGGSG